MTDFHHHGGVAKFALGKKEKESEAEEKKNLTKVLTAPLTIP